MIGMLMTFLSLITLTSCEKEENDFEEVPTESSIIIKGVVTTSNEKPLANVTVKLDYIEQFSIMSETRHKAEVKTDNNGAYQLSFQLKDDELPDKNEPDVARYFCLYFDLQHLPEDKYILPENKPLLQYACNFEATDRGKTHEQDIYVPEKRMLEVTVSSDIPIRQSDEYVIRNTVPGYGTDEKKDILTPINLYNGERTVQIPCALNDSNRISLRCRKEGRGWYEPVSAEQKLVITPNAPQSMVLGNEWMPDEYKFKLSVDTEIKQPSPFDLFTFRVLDYEGNFSPVKNTAFELQYDSIIWGADGYPDYERVVYNEETPNSSTHRAMLQWASYFYQKEPLCTYLKGYKNGKVAYADSLTLQFYPKDFLCFNWKGADIYLTETNIGIYCRLYKDVEFALLPPKEKDGHLYSTLNLWPQTGEDDASLLTRAKSVLPGLMTLHMGEPVPFDEATLRKHLHCLPSDVTPVTYWRTASTNAVLVLTSADEEKLPRTYYIHAEPVE